jgi:hypothetical protein
MLAHAMPLEYRLSNALVGTVVSLDMSDRNALKATTVEVMRDRTDDLTDDPSRPWRPGTLM